MEGVFPFLPYICPAGTFLSDAADSTTKGVRMAPITLGTYVKGMRNEAEKKKTLEQVAEASHQAAGTKKKGAFSKTWLADLENDRWENPPKEKLESLAKILEFNSTATDRLWELWHAHVAMPPESATTKRPEPKLSSEEAAFYLGRYELASQWRRNTKDSGSKERIQAIMKDQLADLQVWQSFRSWLIPSSKLPRTMDQILGEKYLVDGFPTNSPWIWALTVEALFTDPFAPNNPLSKAEWNTFNSLEKRKQAVQDMLSRLNIEFLDAVFGYISKIFGSGVHQIATNDMPKFPLPPIAWTPNDSLIGKSNRAPASLRGDSLASVSFHPTNMGGLHLLLTEEVPSSFLDLKSTLWTFKGTTDVEMTAGKNIGGRAQIIDDSYRLIERPLQGSERPLQGSERLLSILGTFGPVHTKLELTKILSLVVSHLRWINSLPLEYHEELEDSLQVANDLVFTIGHLIKIFREELPQVIETFTSKNGEEASILNDLRGLDGFLKRAENVCAKSLWSNN